MNSFGFLGIMMDNLVVRMICPNVLIITRLALLPNSMIGQCFKEILASPITIPLKKGIVLSARATCSEYSRNSPLLSLLSFAAL